MTYYPEGRVRFWMKYIVVEPKDSKELQDLTIVVTRPQNQSERLCELIRGCGGTVLSYPVIQIAQPENKEFLKIIDQLQEYDFAIFVSANAVHQGFQYIKTLPSHVKIAAVGEASARALQSHGIQADIFPTKIYNSEALLQLSAMQTVKGKRIVIFRGVGGRELLADTLRQRGADVAYVECYRRIMPQTSPEALLQLWQNSALDILVVTSNDGLTNLYDMVGEAGRAALLDTPLLLVSQRTKSLAHDLGFKASLVVADKASDQAILNALIQWSQSGI